MQEAEAPPAEEAPATISDVVWATSRRGAAILPSIPPFPFPPFLIPGVTSGLGCGGEDKIGKGRHPALHNPPWSPRSLPGL